MALSPAEIASRAAAVSGNAALVYVTEREDLVVLCGPDGALRPPRRRTTTRVQILVQDGAGRRGIAEGSTDGSIADLTALAERARAVAAGSPVDLRPLPIPAPGGTHEGYDEQTASLEVGRSVAAARAAASASEFALGRGRAATARCEVVRQAVASSDGDLTEDQRTAAIVEARCSDDDGRLIGHGLHASPTTALLDPVGAGLAATPPQWATRSSNRPHTFAPAEARVILRPAALAPLLCAFADTACTGNAHATGTSPFTGRLGDEVVSPLLTLLDSPRYLHTLARSLDPEGTPAQPVTLLDAGVAAAVLHDAATALEWGAVSTGHAAQLGGGPSGPVARNLLLLPQPGGGSAEDLAARAHGQAIVVPLITAVHRESPVATRVRAIGRAAYLVQDGAPVCALGDVILTTDLAAAFLACTAVGGEGALVPALSDRAEQVRATYCPAAEIGAVTVAAGGRDERG